MKLVISSSRRLTSARVLLRKSSRIRELGEPKLTFEVSRHPLPFKCVIKPRSKKAEELVYTNAAQYDA